MKISDIKLIQKFLKSEGLYDGKIDGVRGHKSSEGIEKALRQRADKLPLNWTTWNAKRKSVAYLQLLCHENGIDSGLIDGYIGPQTLTAVENLKYFDTHGSLPRSFEDIILTDVNPHEFPDENYDALVDYYGEPCEAKTILVDSPWELRLDWNLHSTTKKIRIHEKLGESLSSILEKVHQEYGLEGIKKYGLDRYGGSFNCRKKRGSTSSWSTHAWGIAIDWYPSKNGLRSNESNAALAQPELDTWWQIWEEEGWLSLGRTRNYDWMHIQAAKR